MGKVSISNLNSVTENALRILILMYELKNQSKSQETLCALDFIVIYGKTFQQSKENIHGDNSFKFAEYISRRRIAHDIIKYLIARNLIDFLQTKEGYQFRINDNGVKYINKLNSKYKKTYQEAARVIVANFAQASESELIKYITKEARESK